MTFPAQTCLSCSRPVRGSFCSNCGAIADASGCTACGAELQAGDRHCSQCGAGVSGVADRRRERGQRTAWIVAGIAFAALTLSVVLQRASDRRARDAAAVGASAPGVVSPSPSGGGALSAQALDSIPPRELFDRLYDRIMRLRQEGKVDSVRFFAPMAQMLAERALQPLDSDLRYDLGTIADAAGDYETERAQADTILGNDPDHLLGLLLRVRAARATGDNASASRYQRQLASTAPRELAKNRPEYQRHRPELDAAVRQ